MAQPTACGAKGPSGPRSGRKVPKRDREKDGTVRTCLVTGGVKPKTGLIRFVLGPDNVLVPDLAERLPGRGLWVTASKEALEAAEKRNPFSKAAKKPVRIIPGLPAQVDHLLSHRCLELLGLARSAGLVVTGQPQVEAALKEGSLAFILMAADAGKAALEKKTRTGRILSCFTREQLGQALGRDHLVTLGLKPHSLTDRLHAELMRWQGVRDGELLPQIIVTDNQKP